MSDSKNNKTTEKNPIREQIKFAVVMYGGGSLAIYINGVAQELLKMVQATSAGQHPRKVEQKKGKPVAKTTDIYRKIAFLLSNKKSLQDFTCIENIIAIRKECISNADLKNLSDSEQSAQIKKLNNKLEKSIGRRDRFNKRLQDKALSGANPSVKFVIDVLTGSSAGGINAVYLSKALVNGVDSMDDLQKLWIEQGDFAKLLNDKKSVADNQLDFNAQPASLLNSQRMYLELLKALEGMDTSADLSKRMVEELDLYVTYTDFRGVPLPMFLSDKAVLERRHKQVFNFRFSRNGINDFEKDNNPFLAFAARTTSSFPFAFEPSRLTDIDEILKNAMPAHESGNSDSPRWKKYFRELADEQGKPIEWKTRSFVDGGALDNKPFGYAIDKLTQRADEGIVHRKLLYIEPSPEDLTNEKNDTAKPNAIANLLGQGVNLPRYETIREDLQRLIERNRLIRRMNRITADVERDFEKNFEKLEKIQFPKTFVWGEAGLNDVAEYKGMAFLPYYRLRISALTDDIAKLVTAYFRFDEDSNYYNVLRSLIAVWRDDNFAENSEKKEIDGKEIAVKTVNNFLYLYDVEYRFRRLRFTMRKIENLLRSSPKTIFEDLINKIDRKILEIDNSIKEEEKPKNITESEDAEKKKDKESGTVADTATNRKDGLVTKFEAFLKSVPVKKTHKTIASAQDKLSEIEKLQNERVTLGAKKTFIKEMLKKSRDFDADFFKETEYIQKQVNEIYSRLRCEHEYLQTELRNPELADDLFKEMTSAASAVSANVMKDNLNDFKEKLAGVENILQVLEVFKKNGEQKDSKQLSIAALERLLNLLKHEEDESYTVFQDEEVEKLGTISTEKARRALRKAYTDEEIGEIMSRLDAAAVSLDKIYNTETPENYFVRRASNEMNDLLGSVAKEGENAITDLSKIIREYLGIYYQLFDSYDQISFPVYFETLVGEAVEVDIIRISSRDAQSLINEEDPNEKRRKLAGGAIFNFGAFLDPRWRLNDIMWGRLDGAERLITTLLPDKKYKNLCEFLINESNTIILDEMLLTFASEDLRGTAVDLLTLAGTEAIARNAVDRLVRKLTVGKISKGLNSALTTAFEKEEVLREVVSNYEVSRQPEPEPTLKILSRATQVTGKIFEDIADKSGADGNRVSWVAKLGKIFWGLVTVAVPDSMANLVFNYWLQLLYMFEVVVILGGTILSQPAQQFGIAALLITISLHITVMILQDMMRGSNFPKSLKTFGLIVILVVVALGAFSFYAVTLGSKELWKDLNVFHANLLDYGLWQKMFAVIVPGILLIALISWRELNNRYIRSFGSGFLALSLILLISGAAMTFVVKDLPQKPPPIMAFEFANTVDDFKSLVSNADARIEASNRADLKTALLIDSFIFIPVYLFLFLLLAQLLAFRRFGRFGKITFPPFIKEKPEDSEDKTDKVDDPILKIFKIRYLKNAVWLAVFAALLIIGAGIADGIENYHSYRILNTSFEELAANTAWLTAKTNAALIKFTLTFAALFVLSFNFYRKRNDSYTNELLPGFMIILMLMSALGIVFTWCEGFRIYIDKLLIALVVSTFIISFILIGLKKYFLKNF